MAMKCSKCGAENPEGKTFCGDCGSMIVVPSPPRVESVMARQGQPYRLRMNVFGLIGAVLAVISLFLPWAMVEDKDSGDTITLGAFDFSETYRDRHLFPSNFRYSVTIFLIGTTVAFFCPLGGILQLIGCTGFIVTTLTTGFETVRMIFWIGALVALVSTTIVLASLVYPLGVGYEAGRRDVLGRLLTVSVVR